MDREKVIKGLECAIGIRGRKNCDDCPYDNDFNCIGCDIVMRDALALLQEQEARIQKYEYIFDFLGIGFRQWATKILDGEAEAICETDEHENKTVLTFKLI